MLTSLVLFNSYDGITTVSLVSPFWNTVYMIYAEKPTEYSLKIIIIEINS